MLGMNYRACKAGALPAELHPTHWDSSRLLTKEARTLAEIFNPHHPAETVVASQKHRSIGWS